MDSVHIRLAGIGLFVQHALKISAVVHVKCGYVKYHISHMSLLTEYVGIIVRRIDL